MILLTGASGFIGSKLLSELIDKYGSDYVSAFTSKPINGVRCILHNGYKGGLKQYDELLRNVSVVIHAGAYIPKNSANSNLICENNENIINTEFLLRHKYPCLKNSNIFLALGSISIANFGLNKILFPSFFIETTLPIGSLL